jgi:hypothetical protein
VVLQDVPYSLITNTIAQMRQGPRDRIIAPAAIFLRHTDDQVFQRLINPGSSQRLALLGAVELLGHKFPVLRQDRLRCDNCGDFRQRLFAQLPANLR